VLGLVADDHGSSASSRRSHARSRKYVPYSFSCSGLFVHGC